MIVVAVSRAGVVLIVVPGAAAHDAPVARLPQACFRILNANLI
jgi:hypothetical protein